MLEKLPIAVMSWMAMGQMPDRCARTRLQNWRRFRVWAFCGSRGYESAIWSAATCRRFWCRAHSWAFGPGPATAAAGVNAHRDLFRPKAGDAFRRSCGCGHADPTFNLTSQTPSLNWRRYQ